mgnify:CR=1 FL=1
MADPSGNEDIQRSRGIGWWFWLWCPLGLLALAWLNMARAAAAFWPWWGGDGLLGTIATAVLRPHKVAVWFDTVVWQGVAHGQLVAWPVWYVAGRLFHRPPSQALWTWIYYTSYAFRHAIGAPAAGAGVPAALLVLAWNTGLAALGVWLVPLLVTRRIVAARGFDLRLGTSHWPAPTVLRPYRRAVGTVGSLPLGWIASSRPGAGQALALPLRDPGVNVGRFSHAAVWGVSEAGKTSAVFKPWLWSDLFMNDPRQVDRDGWPVAAMSSVVIDMKHSLKHPDIYADIAPYAAKLPRRLLLLAPGDTNRSLHYNPLDFVRVTSDQAGAVDDIGALAHAVILNTPGGEKDDQWHQGIERNLLKLLIRYVCDVQEAVERGVPNVAGLHDELARMVRPVLPSGTHMPALRSFPMIAAMTMLDGRKLIDFMQATVTNPASPEDWPVRCEHFSHEATRRQELTGWFEGMQRRLEAFTSQGVAAISNRSDFSLDLIGRQPSTLIIGMPRELTKGLEPYSALIVTQLLQQLKRVAATSQTGRLPIGVTLYLDELPAQGRIPHLEHEIATLRDMAVSFVCGMQSSAALEGKYGDVAAEAIKSTTNTKIVIGRNLGLEDAEYFSRRAGETTILTSGTSESTRGGARSTHTARRALITPDQIIRMPQFEALVFLQTGHHTQTRLRPFHDMKAERAPLPSDHRFVDGDTTRDGVYVSPATFLRVRQTELDAVFGPWDTRPPRPAVAASHPHAVGSTPPPGMPPHIEPPQGDADPGAPPEERDDHGGDKETAGDRNAPDVVREKGAPQPPSDESAAAGGRSPEGAAHSEEPTRTEEADPAPRSPDPGALSDLAGLFNTLVRGRLTKNGETDPAATAGWWVRLPGGDHLLLRWSIARSFGELRRTKARDLAERWQHAGFVVPRRLSVASNGDTVPVLAFTPDAVRRLTPAVTDTVGAWPRVAPREIRGFELVPASSDGTSPSGPAAPAGSKDNVDEALQVLLAWLHANKQSFQSPTNHEHGEWDATAQGEAVLLIRQPSLNRILMSRKFDLHAIMTAWRDTGVIVAQDKRFTVYTRVSEAGQTGARFVAFRWARLHAVGLLKT